MNTEKIDEIAAKLFNNAETTLEQDVIRLRKEEVIKAYAGEDKIITWQDVAEKIKNEPKVEPMPTGHKRLDTLMKGGLGRKQLIALTGITKNGKTAMAVDLTRRLEKYNPLWFPFEETIEEIVRKQMDYGSEIPVAYVPQSMPTDNLEWIEEKILESVIKNNSRIVFIDHLQFIGLSEIKQERHDLKLTEIIKGLKKIAQKLDVCVILIAHLRKVDITEQPTITDIKETSSLAQWSDKVLIVWREAQRDGSKIKYTDITYVNLAADRQSGSQDSVGMKFDHGKFTEMSESDEAVESLGSDNGGRRSNKRDF